MGFILNSSNGLCHVYVYGFKMQSQKQVLPYTNHPAHSISRKNMRKNDEGQLTETGGMGNFCKARM